MGLNPMIPEFSNWVDPDSTDESWRSIAYKNRVNPDYEDSIPQQVEIDDTFPETLQKSDKRLEGVRKLNAHAILQGFDASEMLRNQGYPI